MHHSSNTSQISQFSELGCLEEHYLQITFELESILTDIFMAKFKFNYNYKRRLVSKKCVRHIKMIPVFVKRNCNSYIGPVN